jgi:long-chain fatty acid transport protein
MGNTADISTAGAGLAAKARDASTVFSNPAGMTRIKTPESFAGAAALYLSAEFDPDDSTTVSGSDGDASMVFPSGNFAYVHPVNDDWAVGISAQNYFGLTLSWSDGWVGRYQATEETLLAPQVQPSVAYRFNDMVSVGVGAGLTYGYLGVSARLDDPSSVSGKDGKFSYYDTDFAVQGNFGLMIEPSKDTRIGIRYLSETKLEFEDDTSKRTRGADDSLVDLTTVYDLGNLNLDVRMPQALNMRTGLDLEKFWQVMMLRVTQR